MEKKPIIAGITHGDINGIGYEVIIKALTEPAIMDLCVPVVYGSPKVAAYHRKVLNVTNFSFNNPSKRHIPGKPILSTVSVMRCALSWANRHLKEDSRHLRRLRLPLLIL
jgi:4-hydroxy-L-threonine phosphate dehydrogenase PdxA